MTTVQATRNVAGAVALLTLAAAANVAPAAEKPVGTYGERRTVLAFKVSDAAVQTLLPEGWQASPATAGPSKDANLNVIRRGNGQPIRHRLAALSSLFEYLCYKRPVTHNPVKGLDLLEAARRALLES